MHFFSKLLLTFGAVAVGSYFVITKFPPVRERVMAMISPQIAAQSQLLDQLNTNLRQLNGTVPVAKAKKLIAESQTLIQEVNDLNQHPSGIVQQVVGKIVNTFLSPSPMPSATLAPCSTH